MKLFLRFSLFLLCCFGAEKLLAQAELEPWGNLSGIRIDGELMPVNSNLSVVKNDWSYTDYTARERQRPKFERNGKNQTVSTILDSIYFSETVTDISTGTATVAIKATSHADENINGVYFTLFLDNADFSYGKGQAGNATPVNLSESESDLNSYFSNKAKSFKFYSKKRQLDLIFPEEISLFVKRHKTKDGEGLQVFVPIKKGNMDSGESVTKSFTIKVSGEIDKSPVALRLDTSQPGRKFDGLGGNFRLQNPKVDPEVIDYCLKNLEVRWARVEMPWRFWQPELNQDPIEEANAGRINPHVKASMEMAARLSKMGIPLILSAWFPPDWAVVGKANLHPVNGVWGNPLDHSKDQQIYKSIADYISYLKEKYGVEVKLFSFNESDLGINIRQTGEEHDALIKGLGAYLQERGLKTKMLLGDNSDATTFRFIYPALNDTGSHRFIGAISFHSWRGWDRATLEKWADAATQLKKPLIVGEGSIDAQAWGYPQIFQEPMYALNEINLYVRLLSICQPEAILQWQLTSDYSLLAGGGIFGDTTALRPTQRFWNLKQLSSTPKGLKAMKLEGDSPDISAAALGDNEKGVYEIHLVNNGAERKVTISGIPEKVKMFRLYVTNYDNNMRELKRVSVVNGKAHFALPKTSFISLCSETRKPKL